MSRLQFILLIALFSCQPSSFSKADKQVVEDEVKQTLHQYYEDIKKSGLTAEFRYLDSSDIFFWVPPGYDAPISYDSVVSYIQQSAPLFRSVVNEWDSLRVVPLTKELASYTGKLHSTITDTTGVTESYSLIETGVLIKRNDGWKLLHGQTAALP
jgi:hypothetical protein